MLKMNTGNRVHAPAVRGLDLYETPTVAVDTLLALEPMPVHVWEPACGPGAIVHALRAHGHTVTATDLVNYECPDSQSERDFLAYMKAPPGVEAVVTNPPYKNRLAEKFVLTARNLVPRVAMLMRLAFLESEQRKPLFQEGDLSKVIVFSRRLPMMHRANWDGPKANSGMAFAWFVWDRAHTGPSQIQWVDWKEHARPSTYVANGHVADNPQIALFAE